MTPEDRAMYRETLTKARKSFTAAKLHLKKLKEEQEQTDLEMSNLRKTITALAAICSEEPGIDKLGITDSVLEVMATTPFSYTSGEVVSALDGMGFDLDSQKNAQASVHAVLARLAQQQKITRVTNAKKNKQGHPWEWRGPRYNAEQDATAGFCYKPGEAPDVALAAPVTDDDIPF